jgi:predicted DNA-binding transcriptional regulator AlpA
MATNDDEAILSKKQAADLVSLSVRTFERLCRAGEGPAKVRLSPGRVGFRRADVTAWVKRRTAA